MLQTFTFFMLEGPRDVPGFLVGAFPHSDDAVAFGQSLLAPRNGYSAIDVILDDRLIAHLEPTPKPLI